MALGCARGRILEYHVSTHVLVSVTDPVVCVGARDCGAVSASRMIARTQGAKPVSLDQQLQGYDEDAKKDRLLNICSLGSAVLLNVYLQWRFDIWF